MVTECPFKEGDIIHRTNFLGDEHLLRVTPEFMNTVWRYSGEFGKPVYRSATLEEKKYWYEFTDYGFSDIATRKIVSRNPI